MENVSEMTDFERLRGDCYDTKSLREKVMFDMVNSLESARLGDYEPLKRFFESDPKKALNLIGYLANTNPKIFDIRDTTSRGFLEQIGRNVLSGNPVAKDYLAERLSKVFPVGFLGGIESATYIIPYAFLGIVDLETGEKIAKKLRENLFCKRRERQYKEILSS